MAERSMAYFNKNEKFVYKILLAGIIFDANLHGQTQLFFNYVSLQPLIKKILKLNFFILLLIKCVGKQPFLYSNK